MYFVGWSLNLGSSEHSVNASLVVSLLALDPVSVGLVRMCCWCSQFTCVSWFLFFVSFVLYCDFTLPLPVNIYHHYKD